MKKRVIATLCISLAACICFTAVKIKVIPGLMKDARFGTQGVMGKDYTVDWLFMGSSMFRQGIDPMALADEGEEGFLVSFNGNQPYYEYMQLKEITESGTKIDTLCIDMYAYSLYSHVWITDTRSTLGKSLSYINECFDGMRKYGKVSFTEWYDYLFAENNEMVATWPVSYPLINQRYIKGSSTSTTEGVTEEILEATPLHTETGADSVQCDSVRAIVEYCREQGINVVFIETPKYYRQALEPGYAALMREYEEILTELGVTQIMSRTTALSVGVYYKHTTARIYDFDDSNPGYFMDIIHLSTAGRNAFSEVLNKYL